MLRDKYAIVVVVVIIMNTFSRIRDIYRSLATAVDQTHLGHLEVFGPERFDNILIRFDLGRHRGPYTVQNAFERELLHVVARRLTIATTITTDNNDDNSNTHARRRSPHDHNNIILSKFPGTGTAVDRTDRYATRGKKPPASSVRHRYRHTSSTTKKMRTII